MCDRVLIAAILEELGYFDEKKDEDHKDEIYDNVPTIVQKFAGGRR